MKFTQRIFFLTFLLSFMMHLGLLAQNKMIAKQDAVKKVDPKKVVPKKVAVTKPANVVVQAPVQKTKPIEVRSLPLKDSLVTTQSKSKAEIFNQPFAIYTANAGAIADDDFMILKEVDFSKTDYLFYLLVGMFLLLALVRAAFPKYFNDLFTLFFQSTFKQKSIREQLSQTAIPSFLFERPFLFFGRLFFVHTYWVLPNACSTNL